MKLKINSIIGLSVLFALIFSFSAYAENIKWYDYKSGKKLSKSSEKKLYIYFYSENCPWCTRMDNDTLSSKKIAGYLNKNFIPVKVNVSEDMETTRAYGVGPIPANIFMEPDIETMIYNRPGYIQNETFFNIIEAINLEKYK
eukprot:gnl/Chilomastix_cuspidata/9312.p1 GENE.gnl/Chilomastix_cuspidata/9312~~gnl/Chilomastix_cuspidata/9312.p1  ORF type:complete len:142 (+),score=5.32 gnl/Chilomastix_cuspidata/9312:108-533(+)